MIRANTAVKFDTTNVVLNAGNVVADNNVGQNISNIFLGEIAYFKLQNESYFNFTHNEWSTFYIVGGGLTMTQDSTLVLSGNIASDNILSFIVLEFTPKLDGKVIVANNTAYQSAPVAIDDTEVDFTGILEVVGNRGLSGGIYAFKSVLVFTGTANFSDNNATNEGQ